jgi:Peptidase family S41
MRTLQTVIVFQWLLVSQQVFCTPRTVVEQIAATIETNYFDAARGVEISADLRRAAAAGNFDALNDPGDFASVLSRRLQSFDHHFLVTWSAESTVPEGLSVFEPPVPQQFNEFEHRTAYGFHAVEMLSGAIGYIDLRAFVDLPGSQEDPARRTADAALELVLNAEAIILDLRNNPGGSPDMVGYLVSAFTDPKADIYNVLNYRDHSESERPRVAYPNPRLDVPLYVLISGRTASAGESLAYTLQAVRRAVIIGEISAGAANPGGPFPAGDGFFVFVSISTPVNPITGTNWDDVGVKPDVAVAAQQALGRAQILALETVVRRAPKDSDSLDARWTLEALRTEHSRPGGPPLCYYVGSYDGARISMARDGKLELRRARRPPWTLLRVRGDIFFVRDEPYRRVIFQRDSAGNIRRFQLLRAGGPSTWFARDSNLPGPR